MEFLSNKAVKTIAKNSCPSYQKKLLSISKGALPRYMNPYSGTCIQLQCTHALFEETQSLRPNYSTLAYIGAYPEYYFSMTGNDNVKEIFMLDHDMELIGKSQYNMTKILNDSEKWFLKMDYENWILPEDAVEMIVVNDSMGINFSDDLHKTLKDMTSSLKEGGIMIGTSTSESSIEELKTATKELKMDIQVSPISQNIHYPNNLFVYRIRN